MKEMSVYIMNSGDGKVVMPVEPVARSVDGKNKQFRELLSVAFALVLHRDWCPQSHRESYLDMLWDGSRYAHVVWGSWCVELPADESVDGKEYTITL